MFNLAIAQIQSIKDSLTRKLGIVKVQNDGGNELPTGDTDARAIHVQQTAQIVDTNNSSATPLAGGATFTGTATDVLAYGSITILVFADQNGASPNSINVQFSSDGTNWDYSQGSYVAASVDNCLTVPIRAKYFRVTYTNGGSAQSAFRLQTILSPFPAVDCVANGEDVGTNRGPIVYGLSTAGTAVPPTISQAGHVDALAGSYSGLFTNPYNRAYNGSTWDRIRSVNTGQQVVTHADSSGNYTPAMDTAARRGYVQPTDGTNNMPMADAPARPLHTQFVPNRPYTLLTATGGTITADWSQATLTSTTQSASYDLWITDIHIDTITDPTADTQPAGIAVDCEYFIGGVLTAMWNASIPNNAHINFGTPLKVGKGVAHQLKLRLGGSTNLNIYCFVNGFETA